MTIKVALMLFRAGDMDSIPHIVERHGEVSVSDFVDGMHERGGFWLNSALTDFIPENCVRRVWQK